LSIAVYAGFVVAWNEFQNPNLPPGLMVVGAFVIPISVVLFYFEMNVLRNVSIYQVGKMLLLGGILSLGVSLTGYQVTKLPSLLGAPAAGIIEECGKLAALLLVARSARHPWTLNGLLLGGAVGAGFAGFETAGYAFRGLLTGTDQSMLLSLALR